MIILFILSLSGIETKLNIVIIPFKNSHCPTSPLNVFKVAVLTEIFDTVKTAELSTVSFCLIIALALNWADKVSPVFKVTCKLPVYVAFDEIAIACKLIGVVTPPAVVCNHLQLTDEGVPAVFLSLYV